MGGGETSDPDEPVLPIALENPPVLADLHSAKLSIYVLERDVECVPMFIEHGRLMSVPPPSEYVMYWNLASHELNMLTLFGPTYGEIDAAGNETAEVATSCSRTLQLVASEPGVYVFVPSFDKLATYQLSQTVRWYTNAARCKADLAKRKSKKTFRC